MFLKIVVQGFKAGDFLNMYLRFLGFLGSFSYKNVSNKRKTCIAEGSIERALNRRKL